MNVGTIFWQVYRLCKFYSNLFSGSMYAYINLSTQQIITESVFGGPIFFEVIFEALFFAIQYKTWNPFILKSKACLVIGTLQGEIELEVDVEHFNIANV